jgi:hypothetical protein
MVPPESLVKKTVDLQGFYVLSAHKAVYGQEAALTTVRRYAVRCGASDKPVRNRDSRTSRHFRHVRLGGALCNRSMHHAYYL